MCGIAGFCLDTEYKDNHISKEKFLTIAGHYISSNVHRGRDAVGFFEGWHNHPEYRSAWWKAKGEATQHASYIGKSLDERDVPNILGIHTRAASQGFTADNNANNHPVMHNGVLVTHNGFVRNHDAIKRFPFIRKDAVYDAGKGPNVDSVAFAMLLDSIGDDDPLDNIEDIAQLLSYVRGGWALHAFWKDHPHVSLLVAGPSYPLVVKWANGRLVYASEEQSFDVWDKIEQPFPKKAKARLMNPGTFMFVSEGAPIHYGRYDYDLNVYDDILRKNKLSSSPNSKGYMRVNPKIDEVAEVDKYRRDWDKDETKRNKLWTSLLSPADSAQLIYDKEHGFYVNEHTSAILTDLEPNTVVNGNRFKIKDGDRMKDWVHTAWCEFLFEADHVFAYRRTGFRNVDLYGWFGQVEVVITDTGSLLGVFDWSDNAETDRVQYKTDEEYKKARAEALKDYSSLLEHHTLGETRDHFSRWFKTHSKEPDAGRKLHVAGDDSRNQNYNNNNNRRLPIMRASIVEFGMSSKSEARKWLEENFKANFDGNVIPFVALHDAFRYDPFKDRQEIEDDVIYHVDSRHLIPFMYNEMCPLHDVEVVKHPGPMTCDYVLASTLATIARCESIDRLQDMFENDLRIAVQFGDGKGYVNYSKCKHDWHIMDTSVVEYMDLWFAIPEKDECTKCMSTRKVTVWPNVISNIYENFNSYTEAGDLV